MPQPFRRAITRHLLDFWVGTEHLHVGRDLTHHELDAYPAGLTTLDEPEAIAAANEMRSPDRPPNSLENTSAPDWSNLEHRLNYIVELFRTRHLSADVFAQSYPP